MKYLFTLILLMMPYNLFASTFSLECYNFQAIQFDLGEKLTLNSRAATDTYNTKYVFKNGYLYSRYPSSSDGEPKQLAPLSKNSFYNLKSNQEYYEFTVDKKYNSTYVFHKNGYNWTAYFSHGGNNVDKLYQRTYWYTCKPIF